MIQSSFKNLNDIQLPAPLGKNILHTEAVEELFNSASKYFDSMIEDIEKATKCIDLEVYIFGMGVVGQRFRTALCQAADRGVQVRVLVDGAGTPGWGRSFAGEMEKSGIQTRVFHPFP